MLAFGAPKTHREPVQGYPMWQLAMEALSYMYMVYSTEELRIHIKLH